MSLPYFNLYPTDFEAKTSHLSLEEDGAYNRLLRLCWMMPGTSLPDDDAWIMRRMRVDQETFNRVVKVVLSEFFERRDGRVSNARMNREFEKSSTGHERRVLAGRAGGKAKALNTNNSSPSIAKAMPYQPEPEPEPDIREGLGKPNPGQPDNSQACFDHFNAVAGQVGWAKIQKITAPRKAALSQRMRDVGGVDGWCAAIDRAALSPLLTGQSGRGWVADFDWLCKASNFTKLMEGNYDPRPANNSTADRPRRAGDGSGTIDAFAAVAARHSGRAQ